MRDIKSLISGGEDYIGGDEGYIANEKSIITQDVKPWL